MKPFRALTAVEQLAAYLREQIIAGSLGETLPGVNRLAKELAVSPKTIIAAVAQLEHEGLLRGQGERRRCQITPPVEKSQAVLRVAILLYHSSDRSLVYMAELLYRLQESGHAVFFADKSLTDLGLDVERVGSYVKKINSDAWIVLAGSREILEWFASQGMAVFAIFGQFHGLPIAGMGVRKIPAMAEAVGKMVKLGHRRIVMIVRSERRKPKPALYEQKFLDELEQLGIATGPYHLPDWEQTVEGLHRCLDALFQHTPPTLIFVSESALFISLKDYLSQRGVIAPRDVSLICHDPDEIFSWCNPTVSHMYWDSGPIIRRIVRWANKVARGVVDKRQGFTVADFVEGGTIGPPPAAKVTFKN
jgi:DNA-binding LacI/PurR family transcriptional regulator